MPSISIKMTYPQQQPEFLRIGGYIHCLSWQSHGLVDILPKDLLNILICQAFW